MARTRIETATTAPTVEERAASGDWTGATAADFVELFARTFEQVYGVAPELGARERGQATGRAGEMLAGAFGGDADALAGFMWWALARERKRREGGRATKPIGWRLLFSDALVTDYRAANPAEAIEIDERRAIVGGAEPSPAAVGGRVIVLGPDEARVADETIAVLAELAPEIYQRAGDLVHVVAGAQSGRVLIARPAEVPRIEALTRANLREAISRRIVYVRSAGDPRPVAPPDQIVRAVHERGTWEGIRDLRALVHAPIVRLDGSIASEGYDPSTGVFVAFVGRDGDGAIAQAASAPLTHDDAVRAAEELLEIVADFPFETPAHRSAWLAAAVTSFVRASIDGPLPIAVVDKNTRGAGGSLLADAAGTLATGRPLPRTVAPKSAEESRKQISSIAIASDQCVLFDNAIALGDDALDAALTSTTWRDRVLGTMVMRTWPMTTQFWATGTNVVLGGDTIRRTLYIRLASPDERPEERSGFRHPDLLAWIRAERARLVAAALTLLRAHALAGRPAAGLRPWGSYEAWSAVVRSAVVWVGLPDPAAVREELAATADTEANALADLLRAWRAHYGDAGANVATAITQAWRDAEDDPLDFVGEFAELRAALAQLVPTRPGSAPSAAAVGKKIGAMRERVVGGLAFVSRRSKAGQVWAVRAVSAPGAAGADGADVSPSTASDLSLRDRKRAAPAAPPPPTARVLPFALGARRGGGE